MTFWLSTCAWTIQTVFVEIPNLEWMWWVSEFSPNAHFTGIFRFSAFSGSSCRLSLNDKLHIHIVGTAQFHWTWCCTLLENHIEFSSSDLLHSIYETAEFLLEARTISRTTQTISIFTLKTLLMSHLVSFISCLSLVQFLTLPYAIRLIEFSSANLSFRMFV